MDDAPILEDQGEREAGDLCVASEVGQLGREGEGAARVVREVGEGIDPGRGQETRRAGAMAGPPARTRARARTQARAQAEAGKA